MNDEAAAALKFLQGWRRTSSEFSDTSNDELASVITKTLEVMISVVKPNCSLKTVERLVRALANDAKLSQQYDESNDTTRKMTYGLIEAMQVTFLFLLDSNRREREEDQPRQAFNDTQNSFNDLQIPIGIPRFPIFDTKTEPVDVDVFGGQQQIAPIIAPVIAPIIAPLIAPVIAPVIAPLANEREEAAEDAPLVAPIVEEPVIEKKKRGRPKKIVQAEPSRVMTRTRSVVAKTPMRMVEDAGSMSDGEPVVLKTKQAKARSAVAKTPARDVKVEVVDNSRDERSTKRGAWKMGDAGDGDIPAKQMKLLPIKKEPLDGQMIGNDCLVCGVRIKRNMRGYVDHLSQKHDHSMAEHHYHLVCECGVDISRSSDARRHDKECECVNYTVHANLPGSSSQME